MKYALALALAACLGACSNKEVAPVRAPTTTAAAPGEAEDVGEADARGASRGIARPPLDAAARALATDALLGRLDPRDARATHAADPEQMTRAERAEVCAQAFDALGAVAPEERFHGVVRRAVGDPWRCTPFLVDVLDRPDAYALDGVLMALTVARDRGHRGRLSRPLTHSEDAQITARVIALLPHPRKTIRRSAAAALRWREGGEGALRVAIAAEEDAYARATMQATLASKEAGR